MALLIGFISLFCTLLIFLVDDVGPDVAENFFPEAEFLQPDHLGDISVGSMPSSFERHPKSTFTLKLRELYLL